MHVLHVVQGPDKGARFTLPENEPQLLGRSSEALPISDTAVSRRHAELTPDREHWYLRDLDSANGTYVNGSAIVGRVELALGDEIKIGATVFVFAADESDPVPNPIRLLGPEEIDGAIAESVGPDEPPPLASEHLRVIYELTTITSTAQQKDDLLERALDLVFAEFKPQRGFILLQPEGSTRLVPAAVRYLVKPRTRDEGHIPVSRTIVQHVLDKSEGILSTNAMNDARFRSGDSVREYGIRTAICVPVRSRRTILGVIHIDSAVADFSWSDAELRLMNHIGQHVGLALEGAELLESMVKRERLAAMGETVANLSHSIKNILQGLRGGADAVELALGRGDLGAAREGWPILGRNLDRILSLTLNMLAWSKPQSFDIELVPVRPLFDEIAALVRPTAEHRGVRLVIDVDDSMPPVPMDANALHQALMNLVANALDAVPDKRGIITLSARWNAAQAAAEFTVSDNGSGVAPEIRDRMFEPFASSKGQRGTGLGLAVTRKIAEGHGGAIGVQSEQGKGSSFTIVLPLSLPEDEKGKTALPRPGVDVLEGEME